MSAWARQAVDGIASAFAAKHDPEQAARMSAYMRDQFPFLGIRSPDRDALQKQVLARMPPPVPRDVIAFAECCWERAEREYQYAGVDLVRRYVAGLTRDDLPALERLVTTRSWWDTVDGLAPAVGAIVRVDPAARTVMDGWLDASNPWLIRVAILHQERWRDDTDAEWLFAACRRRADHPDFFIRKAIGWALRSYAKRAPDRVRAFLDEPDVGLSPLSRREAERGVAMGDRRGQPGGVR